MKTKKLSYFGMFVALFLSTTLAWGNPNYEEIACKFTIIDTKASATDNENRMYITFVIYHDDDKKGIKVDALDKSDSIKSVGYESVGGLGLDKSDSVESVGYESTEERIQFLTAILRGDVEPFDDGKMRRLKFDRISRRKMFISINTYDTPTSAGSRSSRFKVKSTKDELSYDQCVYKEFINNKHKKTLEELYWIN